MLERGVDKPGEFGELDDGLKAFADLAVAKAIEARVQKDVLITG